MLSGPVSRIGFAGIGAWLLAINRSSATADAWPRRLRSLGILAGSPMLIGIATAPGILLGLDDMETAPAWIWIGELGWLGMELRLARRALPSPERGDLREGEEVRSWTGG